MNKNNERISLVCYNVVKGGGISVVFSFMEYLLSRDNEVVVLCPDLPIYHEFMQKNNFVNKVWIVHYFPIKFNFIFFKPIINYLFLPLYVWRIRCKYIFNFGNVAFPSFQSHFLLMHNAFAVSNDKKLFNHFSLFDRIRQNLMNKFILFNIRFATKVGVQTKTIHAQLEKTTGIVAEIVPNISISRIHFPIAIETPRFDSEYINLLFLSKYYTHKNFESLFFIGQIILQRNLKIRFSITFDNTDKYESLFLKKVRNLGLENIIRNIGVVRTDELMNVYLMHDGLYLPTLMESYSGTYTEAFKFKRPIFTSNRDFAKEVCEEGAFYFDPYNYEEIIKTIIAAFANPKKLQRMVNSNYSKLLKDQLGKESMSERIYKILIKN